MYEITINNSLHYLASLFRCALNALKFQCAQRDSLSELFLEEKTHRSQCKGKTLRSSERSYLALTCIEASIN